MAKLPKVIYVMGPPGAGKGTQAALLAGKIGYHRFSTGDAFRAVAAKDTELGRKVKETIDNGYLAPPEMAAEIVIDAVRERAQRHEGLVFDGTPRTMIEASRVDEFFAQHSYERPLVVLLAVGKEAMGERNAKRKFCLGIQGGFPILKVEDEERCKQLGGTVGVRPDDDPKKFETRWSQFQELTWPVVEQYKREGIVQEVNGEQSIEDVHRSVMEIVRKLEIQK